MSFKNSVLKKQLEKHGITPDSLPSNLEDWISFLNKIDKTYTEFQERNQSLEHTLKVSTSEMQSLYTELQKSSERRMTEAIEAIDSGFILWDKDDKLVTCNSRYKQIYPEIQDLLIPGTAYIEILKRFVKVGRHKDSGQDAETWIQERLNRHQQTQNRREVKIKNRWYLITEYKTSEGSLVSLRTDITPIKDFQRTLEQKESHLKALLNAMPGYVSWIKKDLTYIGVNSNLAKFYERNPVEFIDKPLGFINGNKDDDPFKIMIQNFFNTDLESQQTEFEIPFGKNKKYYLMGLQKFDFGESVVVIGVDISVQKELESQIEIDRRNSFNSAKLSALGEMAAGIAHEINNPLAIIQGSASNMLTDIKEGRINSEKMEKTLTRIDRTVDRAVKIINSLRTFARDGASEPFEPVPIGRIIDETLEFCRTRFFNSKIELKTPLISQDIKISARPIQISQVLLNLLNNSYDAIVGSPSKAWVEVSVEANDSEVCLIVTDSGSGIPADIAAKIMQPFFTTKPPGKGTGLGLSISHSILNDHGGTILIDSNCPNTRFIVKLPRAIPSKLKKSA